ncbi:MAG TPA: 4'-phosphopantetheinyl transferase superfamily protein [Gillisia sp.]|nr:4'-phosphopantetheinyl transferase superfamily protein [Gillisia sp.]
MIGNDIVDLEVAERESNWRRPGYLQKIFNVEERLQIEAAQNPDLLVWTFWSMKEAAYKAYQRKFGLGRSFNPSKISCCISIKENTSASGKVRINRSTFITKTSFKESYVHTTANSSEAKKVVSKIYPSAENVKELLLKEISVKMGYPLLSVSIKKDRSSVPILIADDQKINLPFSISHHGKFSAFSLPLMKD